MQRKRKAEPQSFIISLEVFPEGFCVDGSCDYVEHENFREP